MHRLNDPRASVSAYYKPQDNTAAAAAAAVTTFCRSGAAGVFTISNRFAKCENLSITLNTRLKEQEISQEAKLSILYWLPVTLKIINDLNGRMQLSISLLINSSLGSISHRF